MFQNKIFFGGILFGDTSRGKNTEFAKFDAARECTNVNMFIQALQESMLHVNSKSASDLDLIRF
jgi:hypothetical protein